MVFSAWSVSLSGTIHAGDTEHAENPEGAHGGNAERAVAGKHAGITGAGGYGLTPMRPLPRPRPHGPRARR